MLTRSAIREPFIKNNLAFGRDKSRGLTRPNARLFLINGISSDYSPLLMLINASVLIIYKNCTELFEYYVVINIEFLVHLIPLKMR